MAKDEWTGMESVVRNASNNDVKLQVFFELERINFIVAVMR